MSQPRAAVYLRQSEDKSGAGAAVARQLDECRALAERLGWEVAEVYEDNDTSATARAKPRAGWTRLLKDLQAGRHDAVIAFHTDRLYRRLRDLADLIDIAEERSLRIAAVKAADLDLSTPAGRMVAGMLAHVARYEVEQKGVRQVAANRQRAQAGMVLWTRRPFGFDRDGNEVKVVPEEAEVIRRTVQAVLAGGSMAHMVKDLNDAGTTTSTGAKWTVTSLRRAVTNPRIAGRVHYKGTQVSDTGPAILDGDTFDRLVAVLTDPRRKTAPSTQVKHLMSGLAICGRCGGRMFATKNSGIRVYRCRACYLTRDSARVDEVVEATVIARLSKPDAADLLSSRKDLEALRQSKVELVDRRKQFTSMLGEGLLDAAAAKTQLLKIAGDLEDVQRELDAATSGSPLSAIVGAGDVAARWASLPILSKRAVVNALMTVTVDPAGKGVRFDPRLVRVEWR
ncbi:recombinase family protein [Pedococcus ginsenosidimutans]|uniref:Recombinase family protein n=1 Tax=Pedococcus ginsenosidimutans TaxID=490570 RepID=A0ABP8YA86_9MICO